MKTLQMSIFFIISLFVLQATAGSYKYDPEAKPDAVLASTIKEAKKEDKLILIVFGSDWCPDCRSLNKKMAKKPLAKTIRENFAVMHVDVGNWDKNLEFTKKFGNPIEKGIPSVAVLNKEETLLYVAEGGELATARNSHVNSLDEWFTTVVKKVNAQK